MEQGTNHERKKFLGIGSSRCKGLVVGEGLVYLKNSKEAIMAEVQ